MSKFKIIPKNYTTEEKTKKYSKNYYARHEGKVTKNIILDGCPLVKDISIQESIEQIRQLRYDKKNNQ